MGKEFIEAASGTCVLFLSPQLLYKTAAAFDSIKQQTG